MGFCTNLNAGSRKCAVYIAPCFFLNCIQYIQSGHDPVHAVDKISPGVSFRISELTLLR